MLLNGDTRILTWKNNTYENGAAIKYFSTTIYNPKNKITISCINDVWKVNGNQTQTSASVGDWNDVTNTIYVFSRSSISNGQKSIVPFYENMYLYSLKIWDKGKLIRDFIPVVSLENSHENEACLYDLVQGKFYYNNGTGDFETNE